MSDTLELPVIDFSTFDTRAENPEAFAAECKKAADAFRDFGAVAVRDPRVCFEDNDTFLDMMERYFGYSDGERGMSHVALLVLHRCRCSLRILYLC